MPLSRRLLHPWLSQAVTSPTSRQIWHSGYEWLRRATRQPHRLQLWLRFDDPYSYLLSQLLPRLQQHFQLQLHIHLLAPQDSCRYPLIDAWHLAQYHQLSFHQLQNPPANTCQQANAIWLGQRHLASDDRLTLLCQLFTCVWEHQPAKLSTLALRFPPVTLDHLDKYLEARPEQLKPASYYYQGEWYWGLDDLEILATRLEHQGLNQLEHSFELNHSLDHADFLVNDWEHLTAIRAQKYHLDYYFSFSCPWSYLALPRLLALAEHYRLQLHLKPLLPTPMITDTTPLPSTHLLVASCRHAELLGIPFGRVCLPDQQGLNYCLSLWHLANQQGIADEIALLLLQGIWAEGRDLSHLPHLRALLAESPLRCDDLRHCLQDHQWQWPLAHYQQEWEQLDLPSLPGLRLQAGTQTLSVCGYDRLWAIELALVDSLKSSDMVTTH